MREGEGEGERREGEREGDGRREIEGHTVCHTLADHYNRKSDKQRETDPGGGSIGTLLYYPLPSTNRDRQTHSFIQSLFLYFKEAAV